MEQSSFMFQVIFPRREYEKCESELLPEEWNDEERKEKERKISDTKENRLSIQLLVR
jgi:hypothetical protein